MHAHIRKRWMARLPALAAWALLVAILPTLTYMGHWPHEVPIPGAHLYLWLGPPPDAHAAGAAHNDSEETAAHERHCHGSPASCTDIPFTGASGFAVLNGWLALAGVSGLLVILAGRWWRPARPFVPGPELPPPRFALGLNVETRAAWPSLLPGRARPAKGHVFMKLISRRRPSLALAATAITAAALAFAGCGGSDNSGQTTGVIAAVQALDGAGLHAVDTSIAGGTIPPTAQTTAVKMQTVLKVTKWPNDDLKKKADSLSAIFGTMADALNGDNPDKAKAGTAAHNAHEAAHDFSAAVWSYLETRAGLKAPSAAGDD